MNRITRFLCWMGLHNFSIMEAGVLRKVRWVECNWCHTKLSEVE